MAAAGRGVGEWLLQGEAREGQQGEAGVLHAAAGGNSAAGRRRKDENKNREGTFAKKHLKKNVKMQAIYSILFSSQLNACMQAFLQMQLQDYNIHS
jgi:hypothetical protein